MAAAATGAGGADASAERLAGVTSFVAIHTNLVKKAAERLGITYKGLSGHWIKLLTLGDMTHTVLGYKFPNNLASNAWLCSDKPSCSDCLKERGIPHIRHRLFQYPSEGEWAP